MKFQSKSQLFLAVCFMTAILAGCSVAPTGDLMSENLSNTDTIESQAVDLSGWEKAAWANGAPFGCGFNPANVSVSGTTATITLNNTAYAGKAFSGGELRSTSTYLYGKFSCTMSTFTASGTVQSFFTYNGSPWDEIDIEKIGTKGWQFNYYKNGVGGHEKVVSSTSITIDWQPTYITWGGQYTVNGSASTLPSTPSKLMLNVWNHDGSVNSWLGTWSYAGPYKTTYSGVTITTGTSTSSSSSTANAGNFTLNSWQPTGSRGVTIWTGGVGDLAATDYIYWNGLNLSTGYNNVSIQYASTAAGSVDVRLDSATGTLLGTINYASTGSWSTYAWAGVAVNKAVAKGVHNFYLVGKTGVCNLGLITVNNY